MHQPRKIYKATAAGALIRPPDVNRQNDSATEALLFCLLIPGDTCGNTTAPT
jgi:hypothetical protein